MDLAVLKANDQEVGIDMRIRTQDFPVCWRMPSRLQQAFLNIILNALDAMPDGGSSWSGPRTRRRAAGWS